MTAVETAYGVFPRTTREQEQAMEYGLFISAIRELPSDPRLVCAGEWQSMLPPAPLRAIYFGSEFCEELLPDIATVERFCNLARQAEVEAVFLTPIVTPKGLTLVDHLLQALASRSCTPAVVCNDWGVLNLLRNSYPGFSRRAGRLMNRGLRDPRLLEKEVDAETVPGGRGRMIRKLLVQLGVTAVETDPDLEGTFLGEGTEGLQRVLYLPYAFAASSRNCLIKAEGAHTIDEGFTKGLGHACNGLCRGRWHQVDRSDTTLPLWRAGNTIFYELPPFRAESHIKRADRIVLHERPTP